MGIVGVTRAIRDWAYSPLSVFDSGRLFWKKATNERAHIVSETYTVASDASASLHILNPDASGVTIFTTALNVSTQFKATVQVWEAFDGDVTGGTEVDIDNLLMDRDGPSPVATSTPTATRGVSFTGTATHSNTVIGGGQGAQSIGGVGQLVIFAMEENREIVIEVTNESSSEDDCVIEFGFYEVDQLFST